MTYFIITGVVLGGTAYFIGNLMMDLENQQLLVDKVVLKKPAKAAVQDNGNVRSKPPVSSAPPPPVKVGTAGGPRALV